jgi:hypothetical protein
MLKFKVLNIYYKTSVTFVALLLCTSSSVALLELDVVYSRYATCVRFVGLFCVSEVFIS